MTAELISYTPAGECSREFILDDSFFTGLRGPVGSGKSVSCCMKIFKLAMNQMPSKRDRVRRTRWAVVRNTYPQLKTTTIKTWLDWFPEHHFGKFSWTVPYTHMIKFGDVEAEIIFLALDRPEDIRKLLSLELTGVWINEAREVSKEIVDACTMRVGRYPAMRDGGPSWFGIINDTNAPEDDHWWPIMAGEAPAPDWMSEEEKLMLVKPDGWNFYTQPPAMVEEKNEAGAIIDYRMNEQAENLINLEPQYYPSIIQGKEKSWIDVYVMNRLGSTRDGKPVYPMYTPETHTLKEPAEPVNGIEVWIGIDFGLTPAACYAQNINGRWYVLREVVTHDMGIIRFSEMLVRDMAAHFPNNPFRVFGDPSGDYRSSNDETTPFQILRSHGITCYPAPTNDPVIRIEAVANVLNRMVDGSPGFLINPECKTLIKGFVHGYQYRRMRVAGEARYEDKPSKNKFSHVHDALQYLMLGAGEARKVMNRTGNLAAVNVRKDTSQWARLRQPSRIDSARSRARSVFTSRTRRN